jgi:hypothetical protein
MRPVAYKILLFLLVVIVAGCRSKARHSQQVVTVISDKYIWDSSNCIVHPIFSELTNEPPTMLSYSEFEDVYHLFVKAINEYNSAPETTPNAIIDDLSKYKFQLILSLNDRKEKVVWINCICDSDGRDWKKTIINAADGGTCYFNCKINLVLKRVYEFMVNGPG